MSCRRFIFPCSKSWSNFAMTVSIACFSCSEVLRDSIVLPGCGASIQSAKAAYNLRRQRCEGSAAGLRTTSWVRENWADGPDLVAIDGKTSRQGHNRAAGTAPLPLVSASECGRR
jgi:hypothetical protein